MVNPVCSFGVGANFVSVVRSYVRTVQGAPLVHLDVRFSRSDLVSLRLIDKDGQTRELRRGVQLQIERR